MEAIAILEIISRPIITITPSGPIYVKVGDFVKLECFARGKPAPTVTWDNRYLFFYKYYVYYTYINKIKILLY